MSAPREPVRVFMRIEGSAEVCIGAARTISDVPELLRKLADRLTVGIEPDELERPA